MGLDMYLQGHQYHSNRTQTIKQLENALKWYDSKTTAGGWRWVVYRASW